MSSCFIGSSSLLQSRRVIEMRSHTGRKVSNDRGQTLKFTLGRMHLREPKRYKGYDKDRYPFRAVQNPTRQKSVFCKISGSAGDAERLSRRFLTNLPNEAVVIKMEQCRRGHDAG